MDLLVIKSGDAYLRFTAEGYELTNMSKASVYPLSQEDSVQKLLTKYQDDLSDLSIKMLTITEKDY